jgi:hypothetical protein
MVKRNGQIFEMKLLELKVGDYAQTVNDQGVIEYSKVYYEAHVRSKVSPLLKFQFRDPLSNEDKSIGISWKHLIYAGPSAAQPPSWPILAGHVTEGTFIWIQSSNGKLTPAKVNLITKYHAQVKDAKTVNHRILVNGVHASVHTTNEFIYRYSSVSG